MFLREPWYQTEQPFCPCLQRFLCKGRRKKETGKSLSSVFLVGSLQVYPFYQSAHLSRFFLADIFCSGGNLKLAKPLGKRYLYLPLPIRSLPMFTNVPLSSMASTISACCILWQDPFRSIRASDHDARAPFEQFTPLDFVKKRLAHVFRKVVT